MKTYQHAAVLTSAALCIIAPASAQWVTFENQTALRMPTGAGLNDPATSTADIQQKAYAWGDVDHDGDIDLICVRKTPWNFPGGKTGVLFMNEGIAEGHAINGVLIDRTAQFAIASDAPRWNGVPDHGFLTPTDTVHATLVDVNNDGWLDIVTCATLSDGLPNWIGHPRVYMNQGSIDGVWQGFKYESARIPFLGDPNTPNIQPRFLCVAAGDVTGDGFADLFFSDMDSSEVGPPETGYDYNNKLLINMGADNPGYFVDSGTTRMSANPGLDSTFAGSCAIADMNGDGLLDAIKLRAGVYPIYAAILHNDPKNIGYFPDALFDNVYHFSGTYFSIGDFNNDKLLDIAITDDGVDRYLLNTGNAANGTAMFTTHGVTSQLGTEAEFGGESRIVDLNNDGWNDLLVSDVDIDAYGCNRRTHIYRNLGNPPIITLQEQAPSVIPLAMLHGVHDIAVFDIDGDGWLDIVLGRCNTTEIWRNTTPIPGDANGDHHVNVDDLLAVINSWGPCSNCPADLNHDGQVNVDDLLLVINNWKP